MESQPAVYTKQLNLPCFQRSVVKGLIVSNISVRVTGFLTCFLLRPALRNHEGGDGAPAGRHAADRSTVRLLPQEAGE